MEFYHGTDKKSAKNIKENGIILRKSIRPLDFGSGFYTTDVYKQAESWAARTEGEVVKFYLDNNNWKSLRKINLFINDKAWRDIVYSNRVLGVDIAKGYDIIYGPMIDGRYLQASIQEAKEGNISKAEFIADNRKFGRQFVFKTEKSIKALRRE